MTHSANRFPESYQRPPGRRHSDREEKNPRVEQEIDRRTPAMAVTPPLRVDDRAVASRLMRFEISNSPSSPHRIQLL